MPHKTARRLPGLDFRRLHPRGIAAAERIAPSSSIVGDDDDDDIDS